MIAYKGFNKDLQATMGKGIFDFEPGQTYEESECKCSHNGFHCAENPLCAMSYYSSMYSRYFIVKAEGDINQDGCGSRISCTKITLAKELSRSKMAAHACIYIQKYPERESESFFVKENKGKCDVAGDFIIVRGKNPIAKGVKESYLFLLQEEKETKKIAGIYPILIDGTEFRENVWYEIIGGIVCERKN